MDSVIDLTREYSYDGEEEEVVEEEDDDDVVITGIDLPPPSPESTLTPAPSKFDDHNRKTLDNMNPGDLIEFHRGLYHHWGVSIGEGQIIHLSGEGGDGISASAGGSIGSISGVAFTVSGVQFDKARVKCDGFWEIARGCKASVNNSKDTIIRPDATHVIVNRALSKIGVIGYNVLWSNCEHFSSWCRYGMGWSDQVEKFVRVFDRGKEVLTSAMMLLGFCPRRMRPYASTADEEENLPPQERKFPELEFFNSSTRFGRDMPAQS